MEPMGKTYIYIYKPETLRPNSQSSGKLPGTVLCIVFYRFSVGILRPGCVDCDKSCELAASLCSGRLDGKSYG